MSKKEYLGNFVIREQDCNREADGSYSYYQNNQLRNLVEKRRNQKTQIYAKIDFINIVQPEPIDDESKLEFIMKIGEMWRGAEITNVSYHIKKSIKSFHDIEELLYSFQIGMTEASIVPKNLYEFQLDRNTNTVNVTFRVNNNSTIFYSSIINFLGAFEKIFKTLEIKTLGKRRRQPGEVYKQFTIPINLIEREYRYDTFFFYHSDFTSSNLNQYPLTVFCNGKYTNYKNEENYYFVTLSSKPKIYFYAYNRNGIPVKINTFKDFVVHISFYKEDFLDN